MSENNGFNYDLLAEVKEAFIPMPGGQTQAGGAEPVAGASQMTAAMGSPVGGSAGAALPAGGAAGGQPAVDPNTGMPVDPNTGMPVDPGTGLPIDPSTMPGMASPEGAEQQQPSAEPGQVSGIEADNLKKIMEGTVRSVMKEELTAQMEEITDLKDELQQLVTQLQNMMGSYS
jgi:hypothetical protein